MMSVEAESRDSNPLIASTERKLYEELRKLSKVSGDRLLTWLMIDAGVYLISGIDKESRTDVLIGRLDGWPNTTDLRFWGRSNDGS